MLGHIAANSCDNEILISYVDAQGEIDLQSLSKRFSRTRTAAGLSKPSVDAIESALQLLFGRHCSSMLGSYAMPEYAADDMRKCVEYFVQTSQQEYHDALAPLLKGYRSRIVSEQSKLGAEIDAALESLAQNPGDYNATTALSEALHRWDRLSQPLQLFEQSLGRDEPASRAMFQKIRGLALDLANDHDAYQASLSLSRLCKEVFAELPRAAEQLDRDIQTLDEMVLHSGAAPLFEIISTIDENQKQLSDELKVSKFGSSDRGISGRLYSTFQNTIERFLETAHFDLPWLMLRDLTLKLNNDFDDPASSLSIIEFTTKHPLFERVSDTLRSKIAEDEAAVRINVLESNFLKQISAENFVAAEEVARKLVLVVEDSEKKQQYSQLLEGLVNRNKPKRKVWPYVVGAFVALMFVSELMDQKQKPTYRPNTTTSQGDPTNDYSPPIKRTAPPLSKDAGSEVKPPVGIENSLTIENLRYCRREAERLEIIKARIFSDDDNVIRLFNIEVDDFNSRCSNYRYWESDLTKINAELVARKAATSQEAQLRLERWRTESSSASIQPAPNPQPNVPQQSQPALRNSKLDLLNLEEAAMVQAVLGDLGYFDGPRNGTWGPQSRHALFLFKRSNGLGDDDGFDGETEERLFGNSAIPSSGVDTPHGQQTYIYPPPFGAKLNPLNARDAADINMRLQELGLYKGKQLEIWSGLSRDALSVFRTSKGLPDNASWDSQVEQMLFAGR